MTEKKFEIVVKNKNGIRYGNYLIGNIDGKFPNQAITSTNLGHARDIDRLVPPTRRLSLDWKTKFLEIILWEPWMLTDKKYYDKKIGEFKKIIQQHPDKICLLAIRSAKSMPISKDFNLLLIRFQMDADFRFIKVFFKTKKYAAKNLNIYWNRLSADRYLVPVLDENLDHTTFKEIYLYSLNKTPIIGFLGRQPNESNIDNKRNLLFIRRRVDDKIVRLVSFIKRSLGDKGIVSSLFYKWVGFDVFSFITKKGPQQVPSQQIRIITGFVYNPLTHGINCPIIRGNDLEDSVREFAGIRKSTVPCSVFSIIELNAELEDLANNYTNDDVEKLLGELIKPYAQIS